MGVPDAPLYAGAFGSAFFFAVFCLCAFYPRKAGSRIAIWLAAPSLAYAIVYSALTQDIGYYPRGDGVNYNFALQVAHTMAFFFVAGCVMAAYLWLDFTDGWSITLFALGAGAVVTLSGLPQGDPRFPLFALGCLCGGAFVGFMLWRYFGSSTESKNQRQQALELNSSFARKLGHGVFFFGVPLTMLYLIFVHLCSEPMINIMSNELNAWLNMLGALLIQALPLIVVFTHAPQCVKMQ